jgi:hypothetical protein
LKKKKSAHLGKTEAEGKQIDTNVATYVGGLGNWVRANYDWCFESQRYFGDKGPEIRKTHRCELLAKVGSEPTGVIPQFTPAIVGAPAVAVTLK